MGCSNFIGCKPYFLGPQDKPTVANAAPAPRLLGRGVDGSIARESSTGKMKDVVYIRDFKIDQEPTVQTGRANERLESTPDVAYIRDFKTVQASMLPEGKKANGRLESAQEPALPVENVEHIRVELQDAKAQLEKERCSSKELEKRLAESTEVLLAAKAGVTDSENMRQRLDAAEAQNKELLALQLRLEKAEADAKEERASAITTIKTLQRRLRDVEAEHRSFVTDNLQLKRRLDDHQAEVLRSMDHWRESNERLQEVQAPADADAQERRFVDHEDYLRSHGEKLVESEKALKALQDTVAQAEIERDLRKQENYDLLQRLIAQTEAAQSQIPAPGNEPIHQYKDFKTVRGYRFKVQGVTHKIEVAHSKGKWQMALDGEVVRSLTHKVFGAIFTNDEKRMDCKVLARDGQLLDCILSMEWTSRSRRWNYELVVNNVRIPHCWERLSKTDAGHSIVDPCCEPPEVMAAPLAPGF